MFGLFQKPMETPKKMTEALPGRAEPLPTASHHAINGNSLKPPFPEGDRKSVV